MRQKLYRERLYRACGMSEAMERVRSEMGPEAVILSSRRFAGGVELAAALDPDDEPDERHEPPSRADLRAPLRYHSIPETLHAALDGADLPDALGRSLQFGELPLGRHGPPLLLAGPPGAGKTLTVARLAIRLVRAGTAPVVVTTDGYRPAAVEQLAAFTNLLGLSLVSACTARALARAVRRRPHGAPVLIDSTGCDAAAAAAQEAVGALADAAGANIAAVLPAGMDAAEAAEQAVGLSAAGARFLIATKLDLARRIGSIIAAAHASGLCLTDAGTGPGAADGLCPMTPDLLAARVRSWPG